MSVRTVKVSPGYSIYDKKYLKMAANEAPHFKYKPLGPKSASSEAKLILDVGSMRHAVVPCEANDPKGDHHRLPKTTKAKK